MKSLLILFIMASLSFKLNAFEDISSIKEVIKLVKNNKDYRLVREEKVESDSDCFHCPKYLLLTNQINKVVEKIAKDPKSNVSDELPVKINRLKFLYYTESLRNQNGDLTCKRYMDLTPDLKPTRFDGQFKLIAEDVLSFDSVSEIQYIKPNAEEVVYYYRGVDGDKYIVIQAILTKDGGRFRYYRDTSMVKKSKSQADVLQKEDQDGEQENPDNYNLKFMGEIEKRKNIPSNLLLAKARMNQDVGAGVSIKGSSDLSLKGNVVHLAVKNGSSDLILVDAETKLNGKTEGQITVPYSISMPETLPDYALKGKIQHTTESEILTMSLTDQSIEMIRSEYRKNSTNNKDSYVIARDFQIDKGEVLSVQYGKDEENTRAAKLKHVKSIKENITLVLDVSVDHDKKVSLYYQISAKF